MTLNMIGWQGLPETTVTKEIPPGWLGPDGGGKTYDQFKTSCANWKKLGGYDNDVARLTAIAFRLPEDIKEFCERIPPNDARDDDGFPVQAEWEWFWGHMDIEFEPKNYNVAGRYYDRYTDWKRPRNYTLGQFLTEHGNRYRAALARDYDAGVIARAHNFLKNSRMNQEQVRWVLAPPIGGDLRQVDLILRAARDMPEAISSGAAVMSTAHWTQDDWANFNDLHECFYGTASDAAWQPTYQAQSTTPWWQQPQPQQAWGPTQQSWGSPGSDSWDSWSGGNEGWGSYSTNNQGWPDQSGWPSSAGWDQWNQPAPSSTPVPAPTGAEVWPEEEWPAGAHSAEEETGMEGDEEEWATDEERTTAEQYLLQRRTNRQKGKTGRKKSGGKGKPKGGFKPFMDGGGGGPQGKPFVKGFPPGGKPGGKPPSYGSKGKFGAKKGKSPGKGRGGSFMMQMVGYLAANGVTGLVTVLQTVAPDIPWNLAVEHLNLKKRNAPFVSPSWKGGEKKPEYAATAQLDYRNYMDTPHPAAASSPELFAGIVGREPSARRGILIDTGAAINVHGHEWRSAYTQEVMAPCGLEGQVELHESTTGIKGVGSAQKASFLAKLPAGIRARNGAGQEKVFFGMFCSNELPGDCPALLCFAILALWRANIRCHLAEMEVFWDGEPWFITLVATDSGHLVMPTDNFVPGEGLIPGLPEFYVEPRLLELYQEAPFHGAPGEVMLSGRNDTMMPRLEDWLKNTDSADRGTTPRKWPPMPSEPRPKRQKKSGRDQTGRRDPCDSGSDGGWSP